MQTMRNILLIVLLGCVANIAHGFVTVQPRATEAGKGIAFPVASSNYRERKVPASPLFGFFSSVTFPPTQKISTSLTHHCQKLWNNLQLVLLRLKSQLSTTTVGWKKKLAAIVVALTLFTTIGISSQNTASSNSWLGRSNTKTRLLQRKNARRNQPLFRSKSRFSYKRRGNKKNTLVSPQGMTAGVLLAGSTLIGIKESDKIKSRISQHTDTLRMPSIIANDDGFEHVPTTMSALGPGQSLLEITVAFQVLNREDWNSILNALERHSKEARFDRRISAGLLTSQVANELVRRRSSIIAAGSSYKHYRRAEQAQNNFEKYAHAARQQFDCGGIMSENPNPNAYGAIAALQGETMIGSMSSGASSQTQHTMAVVTLIASIDGDSTNIPSVESVSDVANALRLLSSHAKVEDSLRNMEVVWTPRMNDQVLHPRDLGAFAELRPMSDGFE